ncbi:Holliday junction resolvase RuvX [Planctomicrobium sp. SH664]|uniref:Holliday junction resolvase RuvX n=1 Tax=Planctomicrobium sp. SH664 TaxID=3448125 RepID=UPI003F5BEB48
MAASSDSLLPDDFPRFGTLLGIDYGTKRIGLAISTPDQTIASPLEIYTVRNPQLDTRYFRELFENYRAKGLVVGLPIHISGESSQKSREAQAFGNWLATLSGLPVAYWDERYTSAAAEDYLLNAELSSKQRKRRVDMVAAQIFLQAFLDRDLGKKAPSSAEVGPTDEGT